MRLFFKHSVFLVIAILLPVAILPAQGIYPIVNNVINPLSFTRIGISEWASGGVRTVEVGSPAAAVNNPALLRAKTLSVYSEFGKRSETDYTGGLRFDGQYLLPNVVSVAASVEDLNIALGYMNLYDEFWTLSPIPVTTEDQPDGTGEFIDATTSEVIHTIVASASYSMDDLFSLGITAGMNIAKKKDEVYHSSASGTGMGAIIIAGVYVRPVETFHIGGALQLSSKISSTTTLEGQDLLTRYDPDSRGNNGIIYAPVRNEYSFVAEFPFTAQLGFKWDIDEMVSVMAEADYTGWSGISSSYDDVMNSHFGIVVEPIQFLKIRGGYFTQTDPAKSSASMSINQKFWTAGIEWNVVPGITLVGGTTQSFSSETRMMYFSPPDEPFRQNLYLLGLMYQL